MWVTLRVERLHYSRAGTGSMRVVFVVLLHYTLDPLNCRNHEFVSDTYLLVLSSH